MSRFHRMHDGLGLLRNLRPMQDLATCAELLFIRYHSRRRVPIGLAIVSRTLSPKRQRRVLTATIVAK